MKKLAWLLLLLSLSGCANKAFYLFEGKRYESKEEFHQAVDALVAGATQDVQPLPRPVTEKTLVFAIPGTQTIHHENRRRFSSITGGRELNHVDSEIAENLALSNYKTMRVFGDAVQKRNIFRAVQFVEMQSMTTTFEAAPGQDVIYMIEAGPGSGQWFYASAKHGRQVFAYDRSALTAAGKAKAFVEAVQLLAIRE